jgi:hypothetical protein
VDGNGASSCESPPCSPFSGASQGRNSEKGGGRSGERMAVVGGIDQLGAAISRPAAVGVRFGGGRGFSVDRHRPGSSVSSTATSTDRHSGPGSPRRLRLVVPCASDGLAGRTGPLDPRPKGRRRPSIEGIRPACHLGPHRRVCRAARHPLRLRRLAPTNENRCTSGRWSGGSDMTRVNDRRSIADCSCSLRPVT